MAEPTLEDRVAELKQKQPTAAPGKRNWLAAVLGRFKGDADFAEVARAGEQMRATGRLPDEPAEDGAQP
jgi:hypothetical protein